MHRKIHSSYLGILLLLLTISAFLRLPFLTTIPPGGANVLVLRLPSAIAGIFSIFFLVEIIKRSTSNSQLAILTGVIFSLMPWHIEQSRVHSEVMLGVTTILAGIYASQLFTSRLTSMAILLISSGIFFGVYRDFWLFSGQSLLPNLYYILGNIFKLLSFEFLFLKNDSFWSGGFRIIGTMLSSFLVPFCIGLVVVSKKLEWHNSVLVFCILIILFISALNPLFPEQSEFFLVSPIFSFILANGIYYLLKRFHSIHGAYKIVYFAWICMVIYEHVLFLHFYITHYSNRIQNEIPYDKRTF